MQEVVSLQELVGEFREGKAVAGLTVESALHAVLGHHVVDGDMLAYFACEVEEGIILHPVVVVHQLGGIGRPALKVEEAGQLRLDAAHVVAQHVLRQQIALGTLSRGIANHSRRAAHEGQRLVSRALKVAEHHHAAEVADVQGVCRRVNAYVSRHRFPFKKFFRAGHHLVEHAAPPQFFYKIHDVLLLFYRFYCF